MVFWSAFADQKLAPPPLTGSLREDMIAMLQAAQGRFRAVGASTYYGVLAEADGELLRAVAHFVETVTAHIVDPILTTARERGEIGMSPIPAHITGLAIAILRDQMIVPMAQTPTIPEIVDDIYLPLLRSAASAHTGAEPERERVT
ncbi:TetR/AcrR family transcriptional regulator C-terminal ligand-binding domain-containing protein [Nonomuraea jabiensis]|uniref:TetR/AcrR family transcriptional regulator C-terminal ligand-binding domain-containing protein n=1 Tax=Nonomuraea jabiensis TaxID=882448 RepID=UPI00342E7E8B